MVNNKISLLIYKLINHIKLILLHSLLFLKVLNLFKKIILFSILIILVIIMLKLMINNLLCILIISSNKVILYLLCRSHSYSGLESIVWLSISQSYCLRKFLKKMQKKSIKNYLISFSVNRSMEKIVQIRYFWLKRPIN